MAATLNDMNRIMNNEEISEAEMHQGQIGATATYLHYAIKVGIRTENVADKLESLLRWRPSMFDPVAVYKAVLHELVDLPVTREKKMICYILAKELGVTEQVCSEDEEEGDCFQEDDNEENGYDSAREAFEEEKRERYLAIEHGLYDYGQDDYSENNRDYDDWADECLDCDNPSCPTPPQ